MCLYIYIYTHVKSFIRECKLFKRIREWSSMYKIIYDFTLTKKIIYDFILTKKIKYICIKSYIILYWYTHSRNHIWFCTWIIYNFIHRRQFSHSLTLLAFSFEPDPIYIYIYTHTHLIICMNFIQESLNKKLPLSSFYSSVFCKITYIWPSVKNHK